VEKITLSFSNSPRRLYSISNISITQKLYPIDKTLFKIFSEVIPTTMAAEFNAYSIKSMPNSIHNQILLKPIPINSQT